MMLIGSVNLNEAFHAFRQVILKEKTRKLRIITALRLYFQNLFKKCFFGIQLYKKRQILNCWYRRFTKYHMGTELKMNKIATSFGRVTQKNYLKQWFIATKESQNFEHLFKTMINFSTLKIKSKVLKKLYDHRCKIQKVKNFTFLRVKNVKRKFISHWNHYIILRRIKKAKESRAYESYYLNLLSKSFYGWEPSCYELKMHEKKISLERRAFYVWKEQFFEIKRKKLKIAEILRDQILQRTMLFSWNMRATILKKNRLAAKHRKKQVFTNFKYGISIHNFNKQNKEKAFVWYKWKKLRKFFEMVWYNYKQEKRLSSDYAGRVILYKEKLQRIKLIMYFRFLKGNLLMKHIDFLTRQGRLVRFFRAWALFIPYARIMRKRIKDFEAWRIYKKLYKGFFTFKECWIKIKTREYEGIQQYINKFQKRFFRIWYTWVLFQKNLREEKSVKFLHQQIKEKCFYTLHFNKVKRKQDKRHEEKLNWFIEKKIVKLLKKIIRAWRVQSYQERKSNLRTIAILYKTFFGWKLHFQLEKSQKLYVQQLQLFCPILFLYLVQFCLQSIEKI